MPDFDSRFWNLSQAAAWVVYRKRKLVEEFSEQSADGWRSLIIYPQMHEYERVGNLDDLVNKLTLGKLKAWGRRSGTNKNLEIIPDHEWVDIEISPPSIYRSCPPAGRIEPWTGLRFESKDLKKLWRGLLETEGRTHFKWVDLEKMWHEINERLPDASQNERISELQSEYENKYGDDSAPGRATIQNHIKGW